MRFLIALTIIAILLMPQSAWAAKRITLVNGSGVEVGTASNPLYIQ